jgi:hypothetical protein
LKMSKITNVKELIKSEKNKKMRRRPHFFIILFLPCLTSMGAVFPEC